MKAMLLCGHGGPELLRYGEAPDPEAGPAKSWSTSTRRASMPPTTRCVGGRPLQADKFPHILGRDFSGVVSALGAGVTDFKVGDAVFGVTDAGHRRRLCREDRDQGRDHRQEAGRAQP